jgi:endonuclease/exonuclease/phosphatase family metal-dependent hydrolase
VVTYNVEYALRVPKAVAALRASPALRAPDILLLQEMDAAGVETIARELSLDFVYFPASITPKTGRDFGNAVLSAWPIESAAKLPLPHPSRILNQARAAVSARVCVGGRAVRVYSVHCGSPFGISDGQRKAQVRAVLADARAHPEPAIVGGDFNSHGVGRVLVADGFAWATERVGGTRGRFSFDHVFARGLGVAGAGVVREAAEASDHYPVWATFTLAPGNETPCAETKN